MSFVFEANIPFPGIRIIAYSPAYEMHHYEVNLNF